jgi:hypothetical protein
MDYYDFKRIKDPVTAEHMAYATKDREEALAQAYHDLDVAVAEGDVRTQQRLLGNSDYGEKGELREKREKINGIAFKAGRDYQEKQLVAETEDFLREAN